MGGHLSTYLACASLALAHFFTAPALAQETDGRVLIGAGIAPLTISHATMKVDGLPDRDRTLIETGLGGQVALAAGYGLGSWVLALEAAITHSVDRLHIEEGDAAFSDETETVTKHTELTFGPGVRFLFIEGSVRPFIEVGVGLGIVMDDEPDSQGDATTLYARGGAGAQLRLTNAVSIDLALRFGYASTSGEVGNNIVGSRFNAATGMFEPVYGATVDYTIQQITGDVTARLSIWL